MTHAKWQMNRKARLSVVVIFLLMFHVLKTACAAYVICRSPCFLEVVVLWLVRFRLWLRCVDLLSATCNNSTSIYSRESMQQQQLADWQRTSMDGVRKYFRL